MFLPFLPRRRMMLAPSIRACVERTALYSDYMPLHWLLSLSSSGSRVVNALQSTANGPADTPRFPVRGSCSEQIAKMQSMAFPDEMHPNGHPAVKTQFSPAFDRGPQGAKTCGWIRGGISRQGGPTLVRPKRRSVPIPYRAFVQHAGSEFTPRLRAPIRGWCELSWRSPRMAIAQMAIAVVTFAEPRQARGAWPTAFRARRPPEGGPTRETGSIAVVAGALFMASTKAANAAAIEGP
jgi:hypothetical protein